ncbi:MAG: hypothetical protein ACJ8G7_11880, partial [Rhizobacter sp.]
KGVYFSIITQAMTYATMLLFFRNETGFGGNNGFTDFKRLLGIAIARPTTRMVLFVLTGLVLIGFFEIAIWTAVGGRASLVGPIVGAFFVNGAKSWFTQAFPEFWLYFLGALFIAVTLFLPNGLMGLLRKPGGLIGLVLRRKESRA